MADKDADVQRIRQLIEIMKENDLVKIHIEHGDDRICLERAQPVAPVAYPTPFVGALPGVAGPAGAAPGRTGGTVHAPITQTEDSLLEIKSPIVGTFYEGPSPDSDPYVELGSHVDPQTVVCIIEAMKV
ncbi:MAG: hypothetical protein JW993_13105, partial [Sedimentisphaerales bacterium]|nr:hypothetical protein [Sedimentisphaerales bacterium]